MASMGFKRPNIARTAAVIFAATALLLGVAFTVSGKCPAAHFRPAQLDTRQRSEPDSYTSQPEQPRLSEHSESSERTEQFCAEQAITDLSEGNDVEMSSPAPCNECPLVLPEPTEEFGYSLFANTEVWRSSTSLHCREYARELLVSLREAPFVLVYAGYLDIFGDAWGCALNASDGSSYLVTLRSNYTACDNRSDATLAVGSGTESATTDVSIVHIMVPQGGRYAEAR